MASIDLRQMSGNVFTYLRHGERRHLVLAETPEVYEVVLPYTHAGLAGKGRRAADMGAEIDHDTVFTVREIGCTPHGNVVLYEQPKRWQRDYREGETKHPYPSGWIEANPEFWDRSLPVVRKIAEIANDLTRTSMPDIERARILYEFMTRGFRYGRPHPEFDGLAVPGILKWKQDTCGYYATLYAALLNAAGVPAQSFNNSRTARNPGRGGVLYRRGGRYGLVDSLLMPGDADPDAIPIPGRDEVATRKKPATCHSWTEAQLGNKTFPFDVTWDLGEPEARWQYFAGFTNRGDSDFYHPYDIGDALRVEELPESSLMANILQPRERREAAQTHTYRHGERG